MDDIHLVYGTGPIGFALTEALAARGKRVRMVNRSGKSAWPLPPGVEVVAGNAADPENARQVCRGAAVVYNCTNAKDYQKWPVQFPPLQAGVLEGAAAAGAKLIVMENLYMYGPTGGRPLTEDLPYLAKGPRGVTRAAMAKTLHRAHASGRVRVASGRASDYFGPRAMDSTMGKQVFQAALKGKSAQALIDIDKPHSYSFVPDIARALMVLGEREEALGHAWHIPNAPAGTAREFLTQVYRETGKPLKVTVLPKWLLRMSGAFMPPIRGFSELFYEFEEPFVADHGKFARAFSAHPTPLPEAIAITVKWYRDHGK